MAVDSNDWSELRWWMFHLTHEVFQLGSDVDRAAEQGRICDPASVVVCEEALQSAFWDLAVAVDVIRGCRAKEVDHAVDAHL